MQQKAASLLASQELLAEEEREQARAAAKKAKKDRAKAKFAASQKPVQERPLSPPGSPVQSPSARPLAETDNQQKYDELFKSSISNRDGAVVDKPAATGELDFGPSSTSSGTVSTGTTDQAEWYQTGRKGSGRKGSVLPAPVSGIPAMTAESVLLEPGLPTESLGFATESSGLATETCSSSSCLGSSAQEQRVLRLMICPLTQVQSLCPFWVGQLCDWHDVSWQKLLTAMPDLQC